MSENFENRESREQEIERLIEQLAEQEDMSPDDLFSSMIAWLEVLDEGDQDARGFFQDITDKINIPADELIEYTRGMLE